MQTIHREAPSNYSVLLTFRELSSLMACLHLKELSPLSFIVYPSCISRKSKFACLSNRKQKNHREAFMVEHSREFNFFMQVIVVKTIID